MQTLAAPGQAAIALVRASHAPPTFAVTGVVAALAVGSGHDAPGAVLVVLAVLTGQLSIGWCNDLVDHRRDAATGRRDKPLVSGAVGRRTVVRAAGGALALCVLLSFANGRVAGPVHLAAVAAAWTYNLGVKRTVLSWLPYAVGFGLLPAFVTLALPGRPWPPLWAVAAGALLGTGAHAANVLPDIEDDLGTGVRGLPQRLGPLGARTLAAATLATASAVLVLGPPGPVGVTGWAGLLVTGALAFAVVLPPRSGPDSRLPFHAALGLAALDVALLLARGVALA
ncbi:UbiA family prenyltransferase [Kitasatospora sp. CMC57]|uniref:UbiA family prenyltransferase n=1 Tax=Kitasatospora sp. CMC57 TaxID=3231513 RepID=A0AB33JV45_9ACTN